MKVLRKSDCLVGWQQGETPGPWWVVLFPTFRCNLRCSICSRAWWDDPPKFKDEMSDERLLHLIDECAEMGVREVCIGGGGEPMVRGDLVIKLCERIKHHGMHGILQTNGTLFNDERIDRLARINWDEVSISIDGPEAGICDEIRQKGVFDKAIAAVRGFRAAKKKYGTANPDVRVAMVITSQNYDHFERTLEVLHEAGADQVLFKDMVVFADGMKKFALTEEQKAGLQDRLRKAHEKAYYLNLTFHANSFAQCALQEQTETPQPPQTGRKHGYENALCCEPWLSMIVLCDGSAAPCCSLWEGIVGGLKDKSLREIWLSPEFNALRKDILEGRGPEACKVCQPDYVMRKQQMLACLNDPNRYDATPSNLAKRAFSSLRKYGIRKSIERGRQWLLIRKRM